MDFPVLPPAWRRIVGISTILVLVVLMTADWRGEWTVTVFALAAG